MKLATLKKWAEKNGYTFQEIGNYADSQFNVTGLLLHHEYYGLYPDKNAMDRHMIAWKHAHRYGLRAEQRGHYNGTAIYL